ncbi:MAG: alpha/beta hydrolase family esterase [Marinibacterium sp.]
MTIVSVLLMGLPALAMAGERQVREIRPNLLKRTYIVHFPSDLSRKKSWPVIMAFHPFFTTGEEFEASSKLHLAKGADDFIIVYPTGYKRSWNVGDGCCGKAGKRGVRDLEFFEAIRKDLARTVPINDQVYVTGFSNGSKFVYHLICEKSQELAAAAPAGATMDLNPSTCNPPHHVPILHIHGKSDTWAPLNGGASSFKYLEPQPSVESGLDYLAKDYGCTKTSTATLTSDVSCEVWSGCPGSEIEMCVVPNLGHLWPGRNAVAARNGSDLGPARPDVNASQAIVNFFRSHL